MDGRMPYTLPLLFSIQLFQLSTVRAGKDEVGQIFSLLKKKDELGGHLPRLLNRLRERNKGSFIYSWQTKRVLEAL